MLRRTAAPGPACAADTTQPGTVSKQGTVHEAAEPLITSAHAEKRRNLCHHPVPYMTHSSLGFLF